MCPRGWKLGVLVPACRGRHLFSMVRSLIVLLLGTLLPGARADRIAEIMEIHVAAIGGRERIEALRSFRAEGHVLSATGAQVKFTMLAARPGQVRIETERGGRTLIQGWDGSSTPWEFDTASWPPRYRDMALGAARTFMSDAEFDDPLVAGVGRGFTFDFAGEFSAEGRKTFRILVTRRLVETFTLLIDEETHLILMRVEQRESAGGRGVRVSTHYADYRPVEGVLLPHTITLSIDGKVTQQTKIARIEANPVFEASVFSRPVAPAAPDDVSPRPAADTATAEKR